MSKEYSFKEFIQKRLYNQIFESIEEYIPDHRSEFQLYSNSIDVEYLNGDDLALEDITIEQVYVNGDTQTNQIEFDVIASAEISFSEYSNRYGDSEDTSTVWFRVFCSASLDGKNSLFNIEYVEIYNKATKNRFKRKLSDALVPIIFKDDLNLEAELFLRKYCPMVLEFPHAVSPFEIAEKMGLTVIYKEIIEDCSIFGQIFFQDTEVDGKEVKAGTMFVDSRVAEIRNIGALNNTVIHECVHWHKHRLAFELVRLYEPELSNIATTVEEFDGIKSSHLTATDWMEWHARALAPKILLPNKMFKQHVDFIQREYNLRNNGKQKSYEELIDQLSSSFEVSKLAAKIRLVECGFEQAIGAYNWIDGHYVQAHTWKTGTLNPKQTFTIDSLNAALQSVIDPELREKLNSGKYIYIDSHFVLNTPKYVEIDIFGDTVLTEYALRNMHECALVFDVTLKNKNISETFILSCVLNRDQESPYELELKLHKGYENSTPDKQSAYIEKIMLEEAEMLNSLPRDYCKCLEMVREWRGMTYKSIAEKVLMSDKQVGRIFKGESDGSTQALVSICFVLYLPPEISNHIISNSAYPFKPGNKDHQWYQFALKSQCGKKIDEVRKFLFDKNVNL